LEDYSGDLNSFPLCFISGGMSPTEVPQMVVITFDDVVNDENWKLYTEKLFPAAAKNPNGCPIHGTFYVSHEYTNYAMVKYFYFL